MFNIGEGFSYATIWQPEYEERRVKANLTTSKKLKEPDADGKLYENSSWKAVFVGKAFNQAKDLVEKDRIKIISGTVDNKKSVGNDGVTRYFNNVVIFELEKMSTPEEIANAANSAPKGKGTMYASMDDVDDSDSDIPF